MNIWAIVPVKPLNRAKSRLAKILTPTQREAFAEKMFRHSVEILKSVERISGVLVVSRDTRVLSIARDYHVMTVQESGAPELNSALLRASQAALLHGANGVLVLPADVPFVTANDIEQMLHLGRYNATVVLAPDRQEDGTNALLVNPPGFIPFSFGEGSFARHIMLAKQADARLEIYHSETLSLDIDRPDDLRSYEALSGETLSVVPSVSTEGKLTIPE